MFAHKAKSLVSLQYCNFVHWLSSVSELRHQGVAGFVVSCYQIVLFVRNSRLLLQA